MRKRELSNFHEQLSFFQQELSLFLKKKCYVFLETTRKIGENREKNEENLYEDIMKKEKL